MDGKWSIDDKKKILEAYTVLTYSLKSYGDDKVKERLRAWEAIMSDSYTADQVCAAMVAHAKKSSEIPTPADLIKIINPPEPKITYADYKYALQQHEAEGYPMFGYFGQVIKDYQRQQREEYDTPSYQEILKRRSEHVPIGEVMKKIGESKNGN
jgi:hypothetical protein